MHQSDLMAHPPDSGGQGCAAIIQPPSRFRPQSLFPWASLDRSQKHRQCAVRGFAGPYACVSAGARRRGCGDVSVGPSEGQLGPGPPPRGIGGPWPRPAQEGAGGTSRGLAAGEARPGPALSRSPSWASGAAALLRSASACPAAPREELSSESARSLPAWAGSCFRGLVPHFFLTRREPASPSTRISPEREPEELGAGGVGFRFSAVQRELGGGKVVSRRRRASRRVGPGPPRVGGSRVGGRVVPPAPASARPAQARPWHVSGFWTPACPRQLGLSAFHRSPGRTPKPEGHPCRGWP